MWRLLIPLVFLACNTTESPKTKKVSLNLKETCAKTNRYAASRPNSWSAYLDLGDKVTPIDIDWDNKGFVLPCGKGLEEDPKTNLHISWD